MSNAPTQLTARHDARRTYVPYWEAKALELKSFALPTMNLSKAVEIAEDLGAAKEDVFWLICRPLAFKLRDDPGELLAPWQRLRLLTLARLIGRAEAMARRSSFETFTWMGRWLFQNHLTLGLVPPALHLFYTPGGARIVGKQFDEDFGRALADAT